MTPTHFLTTHAPTALQYRVEAIDSIARTVFGFLGVETLVDFVPGGGITMFVGLFLFIAILMLLVVGPGTTIHLLKKIVPSRSKSTSSSNSSNSRVIDEDDDEYVREAIERIESRDDTPTGDTLRDEIENVKDDAEGDDEAQAQLIQDADEREIADTLAVAPEQLEEERSYLKRNGKYVRNMIIASYPGRVQYGWLDRLFTSNVNVRVSYHINPRDPSMMRNLLGIRAARITSKLNQKKEKGRLNTKEEESQLRHINRLREGLTEGSLSVFDFGIYLEIIADSEEELENSTGKVSQVLQQSNARVVPLYDRQKDAQTSVAPLAKDRVGSTQVMDTGSLGTTFPFIEPSVVHEEGVLFGFHRITNTPVVVDRFDGPGLSGNNMLISGTIGSGKSYFAKLETWRRLMMDPEVEVLIIDPVGGETGFTDLVQALDGQRITVDGENMLNPLDISRDESEEQRVDAYEQKVESVLGMCKASFRGDLDKQEEGILQRAIRFAYLKKGITQDSSTHDKEPPTMQTVLDILKEMSNGKSPRDFMEVKPEYEGYISAIEMQTSDVDENAAGDRNEFVQRNREQEASYAQNVWLGLEDFQEGGQNAYLNGQTNVEIGARVVQFDISAAVDKNSAPLLMHVVLDWLFQRTKQSDSRNQVVIDEAHYMLQQEQALDMLELFARHSRHYDSGLTLISQTVSEFLLNEQTRAIYGQCHIRALMRHEDLGEDEAEALSLTPQERQFVLQAKAGKNAGYSECLMHVGEIGKMRLSVISNEFEHTVIDDEFDPWAYMYEADMTSWWDIPEEKQKEAWNYLSEESRREIQTEYQQLQGQ